VFPLTAPDVAVIVAFPRLRAVTAPLTVIDATALGEELQATVFVMSCVLPSENVPVAVNCRTTLSGIVVAAGVTRMEVRVPVLTVSVLEAETPLEDAVMIGEPAFNA
jgi:hypothetical protein